MAIQVAASTAGNPKMTESEIVRPPPTHVDRLGDIDRPFLPQHELGDDRELADEQSRRR